MSRATVELDSFRMKKEAASAKVLDRRRSFRDLQSAISKIHPDLLKSVIESGMATEISRNRHGESIPVPSTPKVDQSSPVCRSFFRSAPGLAPLTIFYNGIVSVFDVPRDKAEIILNLAAEGCVKTDETEDEKQFIPSNDQQKLVEFVAEDMPIARRKSLKIFLEKRKERYSSLWPYADCD